MSQQINLQQFLTCKQKLQKKAHQSGQDSVKQPSLSSQGPNNAMAGSLQQAIPESSLHFSSPKMLSQMNTPLQQKKLIFNLKFNSETVEIAASQCPEAIRSRLNEHQLLKMSTTGQLMQPSMLQSPNSSKLVPLSYHYPQTNNQSITQLNQAQIIDIEVQASSQSFLILLQLLDSNGMLHYTDTDCLQGSQAMPIEQFNLPNGLATVKEILNLVHYFEIEDQRIEQWCKRALAENRISGEILAEAIQAPNQLFIGDLIQKCQLAQQSIDCKSQKLLKQVTWTARMENLSEKISKPFLIQQSLQDKNYDLLSQIRVIKNVECQRYDVFLEQVNFPKDQQEVPILQQEYLQEASKHTHPKRNSKHSQRNENTYPQNNNQNMQAWLRKNVSTSQNMSRSLNLGDWNINTSMSLKRHNSLKYQQSLKELKKQIQRPIQSRIKSHTKFNNFEYQKSNQHLMNPMLVKINRQAQHPTHNTRNSIPQTNQGKPIINKDHDNSFKIQKNQVNNISNDVRNKQLHWANQTNQIKKSGLKKKDFLVQQQNNGKVRPDQESQNFTSSHRFNMFKGSNKIGHFRSKSLSVERKTQINNQNRRTRSRNANSVNERATMAAGQSLFSVKNMLINYRQIVQHGKNSQLYQTQQSIMPNLGLKTSQIGKNIIFRKRRHTNTSSMSPSRAIGRCLSALNAPANFVDKYNNQNTYLSKTPQFDDLNLIVTQKNSRKSSYAANMDIMDNFERNNDYTSSNQQEYQAQNDIQQFEQFQIQDQKKFILIQADQKQVEQSFRSNKQSQRLLTAANSEVNFDEQIVENVNITKFENVESTKNVHQSLMSHQSEEEIYRSDRITKLVNQNQPIDQTRCQRENQQIQMSLNRINQDKSAQINRNQSFEQNQSYYTGMTSKQILELPAMTNSEMKTIGTKSICDNIMSINPLNFSEINVDIQKGSNDEAQSFKDISTIVSMIQANQQGYFSQKIGSIDNLNGSTNLHINLMIYSSKSAANFDCNMLLMQLAQEIDLIYNCNNQFMEHLIHKGPLLNPAQIAYVLPCIRALNISDYDKDSFVFKTIILTLVTSLQSCEKIMNRNYFTKLLDEIKWPYLSAESLKQTLNLIQSYNLNNVWLETLNFILIQQLSIIDSKNTPQKQIGFSLNQYQRIENLNTSQFQERLLRKQQDRPQIFINLKDVISNAQNNNQNQQISIKQQKNKKKQNYKRKIKQQLANQSNQFDNRDLQFKIQSKSYKSQQNSQEKQQRQKQRGRSQYQKDKNKENLRQNGSSIKKSGHASDGRNYKNRQDETSVSINQTLLEKAQFINTSKSPIKKLKKNKILNQNNIQSKPNSSANLSKDGAISYHEVLEQRQLSKSKTKLKSQNKLIDFIKKRDKEIQIKKVRHNSLTGQEGTQADQILEKSTESVRCSNSNTISKLDHIKLKDLKKIKSKYQQRIKQNKNNQLKNNIGELQASMDFASPRQSKLHLISVAQSNQNLVDPAAGLELGYENRPDDDDCNGSSYKLSKIQSEIQLLQVNKTQSTCNVNDTYANMTNLDMSNDQIIRSQNQMFLKNNYANRNEIPSMFQRQQQQSNNLINKPQNQNQLTFNNLHFMNDQDASLLSDDAKIPNSTQNEPSSLPQSEGVVNSFNINQCQNLQFLGDNTKYQLQNSNGSLKLNDAITNLYPIVSMTSGNSSLIQDLKNQIITPKPSANPSMMFMSNQQSNLMPTTKKELSLTMQNQEFTPGINTVSVNFIENKLRGILSTNFNLTPDIDKISPQLNLNGQQLLMSQNNEANTIKPLLPQKVMSYPNSGLVEKSKVFKQNLLNQNPYDYGIDTVLHTKEDEDLQQQQSIQLLKKQNIILNTNLQYQVKNFEKDKKDKQLLQELSNKKYQNKDISKIVDQPPVPEQVSDLAIRSLYTKAPFNKRSKSMHVQNSTNENNILISHSDNIRNQLRKKYKKVQNQRKNSVVLQNSKKNSRNRDIMNRNVTKTEKMLVHYKKVRNTISCENNQIKPIFLVQEKQKQDLNASMRVGSQTSIISAKDKMKQSNSSKYQKMFQKQNKALRKSIFLNQKRKSSLNNHSDEQINYNPVVDSTINKQEDLILSNEAINKFSQSTNNVPNQIPDIQINQRDQSINERIAMSILNSPNSYGSNARSIMNRTFHNQRDIQQKQINQINSKFICAPHQQTLNGQQTPFQFQFQPRDTNQYWLPNGIKQQNQIDQRRNTVSTNICETSKGLVGTSGLYSLIDNKQQIQIDKNQKGLNTQQHPTSRVFDRSQSMHVNGEIIKTNLNGQRNWQDGFNKINTVQPISLVDQQFSRDQLCAINEDNNVLALEESQIPFRQNKSNKQNEVLQMPIDVHSNFEKSNKRRNYNSQLNDHDHIEIDYEYMKNRKKESNDENSHLKQSFRNFEKALDHNIQSNQILALHVRGSELEPIYKHRDHSSKVYTRKQSAFNKSLEYQVSRNEPNNNLPSIDFKGFDNNNPNINFNGYPTVSPLQNGHSQNQAMLQMHELNKQNVRQKSSNTQSDIRNLFHGLNDYNTGKKNIHEIGSSTFQEEHSQLAVERVNHFLQQSLLNSSSNKQQMSYDEAMSEGKEMIHHLLFNSFQNQKIMNAKASNSNVTLANQKIISPSEMSLSDNTQLILGVMGLGNGTNISKDTNTLSKFQHQLNQYHAMPTNANKQAMTSFQQQTNSFQNSDQPVEIGQHLAHGHAGSKIQSNFPSQIGSINSNEENQALIINNHNQWPGMPNTSGLNNTPQMKQLSGSQDHSIHMLYATDDPLKLYHNAEERKKSFNKGKFKKNGDIHSLLTESLEGPNQQKRSYFKEIN